MGMWEASTVAPIEQARIDNGYAILTRGARFPDESRNSHPDCESLFADQDNARINSISITQSCGRDVDTSCQCAAMAER